MSILIKNVLHEGKQIDVYIEENRIAEIGARMEAEHIIEGSNLYLLPGLINTHTHAAMTLFRGYADDMKLHEWLRDKIWPLEAKVKPEDIYWGTRLACLEMIRSGTTCFNDMYFQLDQMAKAVEDSGIRAVLSEGFIDFLKPEVGEENLSRVIQSIRELREVSSGRIGFALGPHAIYTVSKESLQKIREISDKEDIPIHFHLSETHEEVENCKKEFGMSPVAYLDEIGFLTPRLIAAHCAWLDDEEIKLLAKADVKVSYNPVSNMKLAVGHALPYLDLKKAGIKVSLGTDGAASNNNLDMLETMKFAALHQKFSFNDSTILPSQEAFQMATINGAYALGIDAGAVEVGKLADLVLVNLRSPQLNPNHNMISNLVYSANGSCVDSVIVDGRILMEHGHIEGEEEVVDAARKAAEDLVARRGD